ncbi:MAG: N-acetylneuraminate synthase family protein, partial [Rickettsiales bacterium]
KQKPVYIIAEAGVNHNGSLEMAKKLIDIAADAGADAVKFQTFTADNLLKKGTKKAPYQLVSTGSEADQYQMIKDLELSPEAHFMLADYAKSRNIDFLSTPFDIPSAKFLAEKFKLPYMKVPSCDLTNAPLLYEIAKSNKKIILSTGMSKSDEIEEALGVISFAWENTGEKPSEAAFKRSYNHPETQKILAEGVTLMHCISNYPAPRDAMNLNAIKTMSNKYNIPVGYSDHSLGIDIALMAVALGANTIEKHFTIDKNLPGPDHPASLDAKELKEMVSEIRKIEKLRAEGKSPSQYIDSVADEKIVMGSGVKEPHACELQNIVPMRKSLVANSDIKKGQVIKAENIIAKRPAVGIPPIKYWEIIGSTAEKDYTKDEEFISPIKSV